jgi:quinol monooxygenase YgiN
MYGTVARMKVKPGSLEALQQQMASLESDLSAGGWQSTTVYQSDSDPNELWIAVVFESKEAYRKNAESPEQNSRYEQMRALLDADPEWHDGEVISTGR